MTTEFFNDGTGGDGETMPLDGRTTVRRMPWLCVGRITKKGAAGAISRIIKSVCLVKRIEGGNCPLAGNNAPSAAIDSFLTP